MEVVKKYVVLYSSMWNKQQRFRSAIYRPASQCTHILGYTQDMFIVYKFCYDTSPIECLKKILDAPTRLLH